MAAHALYAQEKRTQIQLDEISIVLIDIEEQSVRMQEDDEAFEQLCASIEQHGLIEPIAVRENGMRYVLVTGMRRLKACKALGFSSIPAQIFKACDAREAWLMSLSENLHRKALHYFEEAQGYRRALIEFGMTQEWLSQSLGRSQSTIANKLRLLQFNEEEQNAIRKAALSERHARALLVLDEEETRKRLIALCAQQEMTVRQLEALIAQELAKKQAGHEKRILLIMHDQRLYINAIRDIVSQMKASGIQANMKMEDLGDRIEMRVTLERAKEKEKCRKFRK